MKKLSIVKHYTDKELSKKIKKIKDANLVFKLTAIYIMQSKELSCNETSAEVGVSHDAVRRWVHLYNEKSIEGLIDKRKNNKRPNHLFTKEFLDKVEKLLSEECPYGGIWIGKKLQRWIENNYSVRLGISTIYRLVKRLGYSWKTPRPKHKKGNKEEQENFKKKLYQK